MRRTLRRGVTLVEIIAGVFILALSILTASALLPAIAQLRTNSGDYTRAATLLQRKMEQIRNLEAAQITASGLRTAGIIDTTNTSTAANTYSFTTVDGLASEFREGAGTIQLTNTGTDLVRIDVTLTWRGLKGKAERIDGTTFVASLEPWREP